MKILGYLKNHWRAVLAVVLLLVLKSGAELALPAFTSQIVDVGIQQSGVEDVATEVMTASTYDKITEELDPSERSFAQACYAKQDDGFYHLTDQGYAERARLDELLLEPMIRAHEGEDLRPDSLMGQEGASSQEQSVSSQLAAGEEDALKLQVGLAAARSEYQAAGFDLFGLGVSYVLKTGGIMLALAALSMAFDIIISFVASRTGAAIGRNLREKLFARVVSFSDAEINRFSAASLITRGTNDITLIQMICIIFLRMVLYAPILAIGGVVMVMVTNPDLGIVVVFAVVAVFAVIAILFGLTLPKFRIMQSLIDRVNLVAREMLTGLPVIRAFGRDSYEEERFDKASSKLMRTQLFTNRAMAFMMPTMMMIMNLTSVAIVWLGSYYVDAGTFQTGDLIAFITYSMVIIAGCLMMGMISILLPRANVAADRVEEVLSCEPSVCDPEQPQGVEIKVQGQAQGARIEFDNVSFSYGADTEQVLKNISFTAEPGQTVALVGSTGSGKSTVIKLIERFYDASEGSVRINGVDVRHMSQANLRALLGYVPQKAFLFQGTIESNVKYGNADAAPGDVQEALEVSCASEFVKNREEGLQTPISQGGTNISGGQRQRLAMARALVRKPHVYLFDDSFSALDYRTDALVRSRLADYDQDATRIIVAQRISSIMFADLIVVMEEGRVVGKGTHAELLQTCEEYREIAYTQLSEEELQLEGGGLS